MFNSTANNLLQNNQLQNISLNFKKNHSQSNINFVAYNCYGFKSNRIFIKKLISQYVVCFFSEHWLAEEEEILFKELSNEHEFFFKSSYSISKKKKRKGRPFGGTCWCIRKNIKLENIYFYDVEISTVVLNLFDSKLIVHGVWLPFDNGTDERLSNFKSNLSLLKAQIKNYLTLPQIIFGDFNASFNRSNETRFDRLLKNFLIDNKLKNVIEDSQYQSQYTYKKGNYTACIDHIITNEVGLKIINNSEIINCSEDLSDHKPVAGSVFITNKISVPTNSENLSKKFHKFDWKNNDFISLFKLEVSNINLDFFSFDPNDDLAKLVDDNINYLTKWLIKCARKAETELLKSQTKKNFNENKNKLNFVLRKSKKLNYQRFIKEERRKIRRDYQMKSSNNCLKIDQLLDKNRDEFWRAIKKFKKKQDVKTNESFNDVNQFAEFYSRLFSHEDRESNEEQKEIERDVKLKFQESLKQSVENKFSVTDIKEAVNKLKLGKSVGVDYISNEMLRFGMDDNISCILAVVFNNMVKHGYTPENFNISLVTPIPKKGEMKSCNDFRPISVSTTFASLFEGLILSKMDFSKLISNNQFGYKPKSSTKHAFFIVNETINYYKNGGSDIKLASLDATKAFDKLWRAGRFKKLYTKIDIWIWRSIMSYYNNSKIIVKINQMKSNIYQSTEGVKQGGKLSAYLFNFFINDMLEECLKLDIGAKIGQTNVSIIAYCDDILILSPSTTHLNKLLDVCFQFSLKWKIEFNPTKSCYSFFGSSIKSLNLHMNGISIPYKQNFIYLGFPIGTNDFVNEFIENKFKKVEKSFYSLYTYGCKPNGLSPFTIAFIYKQYCQSIFKYALELIFMSKKHLQMLNIRQNILIKRSIGLSKFVKTTPLFNCLKIDSIEQLYLKHKVYMYKQIKLNIISNAIFLKLKSLYDQKVLLKENSFFGQLEDVKKITGTEGDLNPNVTLKLIQDLVKCENAGLLDSVKYMVNNIKDGDFSINLNILYNLLKY